MSSHPIVLFNNLDRYIYNLYTSFTFIHLVMISGPFRRINRKSFMLLWYS